MTKENDTSLEFKLKEIGKTKSYLLQKIKHNELINKKHKMMRLTLILHLSYLDTVLSRTCIYFNFCFYWLFFNFSISSFASLVGILLKITSSAIGLKICMITVEIKNYKSIIKKKRRRKMTKYYC